MNSEIVLHRQDIKGVVFSSGKNEHVAEALVQSMNKHFPNNPWEHWRTLFVSGEVPILNQFLKRLLVIDSAVLLLTDDDIIEIHPYREDSKRKNEAYELSGPRDNVVFEVGAIMSRVGLKRTFIVTPDLDEKHFRIMDYLKKFELIRYPKAEDVNCNRLDYMGVVAEKVIGKLAGIGEDIYHSDLPALGLCYGYFWNFLNPVIKCLRKSQSLVIRDETNKDWRPDYGYTITMAIPNELMGQRDAKEYMDQTLKLKSTSLQFDDGRNPGVFILNYAEGSPLHIIDIPTTLFTSKSVIGRVEHYWAEQDAKAMDSEFVELLTKREILSFRRQLNAVVKEKTDTQECLYIVDINDLPTHLESLQEG
jgi:hypothetical protein